MKNNRVESYFDKVMKADQKRETKLRKKRKEKMIKVPMGQYWVIPTVVVDAFKRGELTAIELIMVQAIENTIQYGEYGTCFLSNLHLAKLLNCSERNIKRILQKLVNNGTIIARYKRRGSIITKRYLATKWTWRIMEDRDSCED